MRFCIFVVLEERTRDDREGEEEVELECLVAPTPTTVLTTTHARVQAILSHVTVIAGKFQPNASLALHSNVDT